MVKMDGYLKAAFVEIENITLQSTYALSLANRSKCCKMNLASKTLVLLVLLFVFQVGIIKAKKCVPAIFNFGDSNSDTGKYPEKYGEPYGTTFFKRHTGRVSDGRLTIDFIAQALGLPFLEPYRKVIRNVNFKHGVNFATAAAPALPRLNSSVPPSFTLDETNLGAQVAQMRKFKRLVENYHKKDKKMLPSPNIFRKSLYTVYIGQNDFTSKIERLGVDGVKKFFPEVVDAISKAILDLHGLGGRYFFVFGVGPVGCYPSTLEIVNSTNSDIDAFNCYWPLNEAILEFNTRLKNRLGELREHLPDASQITYVDVFSVIWDLFKNPAKYGMSNGVRACCGHGGPFNFNFRAPCGSTMATACPDPEHYVIWDGFHTTEAANRVIASAILKGTQFEPSFPLHKKCRHSHHIGQWRSTSL